MMLGQDTSGISQGKEGSPSPVLPEECRRESRAQPEAVAGPAQGHICCP